MYKFSAGGDDVFLLYEYELHTGEVHRNTEVLTVHDGQLVKPRCSSVAASNPDASLYERRRPDVLRRMSREPGVDTPSSCDEGGPSPDG